LVYGTDAVLPIEIEIPTKRVKGFEEHSSKPMRLFQLNTINEFREKARVREATLKMRV